MLKRGVKMNRIMLVCCAGMSTSLLVSKMKAAAALKNIEADIFAVGESDAKRETNVQAVLLGPQVRFLLGRMKEIMSEHGIPVQVIDSIHYGTINGDAVLMQAISMIEKNSDGSCMVNQEV